MDTCIVAPRSRVQLNVLVVYLYKVPTSHLIEAQVGWLMHIPSLIFKELHLRVEDPGSLPEVCWCGVDTLQARHNAHTYNYEN